MIGRAFVNLIFIVHPFFNCWCLEHTMLFTFWYSSEFDPILLMVICRFFCLFVDQQINRINLPGFNQNQTSQREVLKIGKLQLISDRLFSKKHTHTHVHTHTLTHKDERINTLVYILILTWKRRKQSWHLVSLALILVRSLNPSYLGKFKPSSS